MKIHLLQTGPFGVNTWIVEISPGKVLIFDPAACAFTHDENKIISFLSENNLSPIAFILTHGHFDHITGTGVLKNRFPDVPLICHKNDLSLIGSSAVQNQASVLFSMGLEELAKALENLPDADISFSGQVSLDSLLLPYFSEELDQETTVALKEWVVMHTPGHTPGSVCWYNEKGKILISGDTVFFHSWGRTDLPGGSESDMISSLNKIYSKLPADLLVYPGHDRVAFLLGENR